MWVELLTAPKYHKIAEEVVQVLAASLSAIRKGGSCPRGPLQQTLISSLKEMGEWQDRSMMESGTWDAGFVASSPHHRHSSDDYESGSFGGGTLRGRCGTYFIAFAAP
eukprot:6020409-Amphidinium_carterae.1